MTNEELIAQLKRWPMDKPVTVQLQPTDLNYLPEKDYSVVGIYWHVGTDTISIDATNKEE